MISVYSLAAAVNESATGVQHSDVPAYEFAGSIIEACYEMDFNIMSESVEVDALMTMSNEIMAEAAVSNPSVIGVLQENVFTSVKDAIVKFFKKVIAAIKGIIEKLKVYFYKMTNKTDEWYKIMEPKVKAAAMRKGAAELTVEMYDWKSKFIIDELPKKADKLVDAFKSHVSTKAEKIDTAIFNKGRGASDEALQNDITEMKKEVEECEKDLAKDKVELLASFGIGKSQDAKDVNTIVDDMARGTSEKRVVKVMDKYSEMLDTVKESKNAIEKMRKAYEKHEKDVTAIKDKIEKLSVDDSFTKAQNKERNDATKYNQAYASACVEVLQANLKYQKEMTAYVERVLGTIKNKNIGYVQSMTQDYMTALTKFASVKK